MIIAQTGEIKAAMPKGSAGEKLELSLKLPGRSKGLALQLEGVREFH